jgi:hypothetical protein
MLKWSNHSPTIFSGSLTILSPFPQAALAGYLPIYTVYTLHSSTLINTLLYAYSGAFGYTQNCFMLQRGICAYVLCIYTTVPACINMLYID